MVPGLGQSFRAWGPMTDIPRGKFLNASARRSKCFPFRPNGEWRHDQKSGNESSGQDFRSTRPSLAVSYTAHVADSQRFLTTGPAVVKNQRSRRMRRSPVPSELPAVLASGRAAGGVDANAGAFPSKIVTEDGRSQPSSSRRTRPSHRLRAAQSARFFQIIPIKMKRAISVRKATLIMATVRNTSAANRGFMSCLASCEAPGSKSFRLEIVSVPNADGARCEQCRRPRRPTAKSANGSSTGLPHLNYDFRLSALPDIP
jgi:hypothetical protein